MYVSDLSIVLIKAVYITDTAPLGKFNVSIDERYGRYGGDLIAGSPCAVNSEIQLT